MTLLDRLANELKAAMIAKDAERLSTLRLLKSAAGYAQIERGTETLTDAEVVALIQKEVKKRRDAVEQYEKGGRPELANKEKQEITVLESFLPKPLTLEELEQLVRAAIQETGAFVDDAEVPEEVVLAAGVVSAVGSGAGQGVPLREPSRMARVAIQEDIGCRAGR